MGPTHLSACYTREGMKSTCGPSRIPSGRCTSLASLNPAVLVELIQRGFSLQAKCLHHSRSVAPVRTLAVHKMFAATTTDRGAYTKVEDLEGLKLIGKMNDTEVRRRSGRRPPIILPVLVMRRTRVMPVTVASSKLPIQILNAQFPMTCTRHATPVVECRRLCFKNFRHPIATRAAHRPSISVANHKHVFIHKISFCPKACQVV